MRSARFVIDWDDTLVEDRWPDQGPWLPGAVSALHELSRHGDIIIFSCRVSPFHFPAHRVPAGDVPRDPAETKQTIDRMRDMLVAEGLGHIEIWQRPYKPNATVYIDNRGVRFTGDWNDTLADVYEAMNVGRVIMKVDRVIPELRKLMEGENVTGATDLGRHPSSQRFHDILDECKALHDQKQQDYGRENDPFANVRGSEEWDVPPWIGGLIRATDKIRRLQKYARTGELANEGVEDAFKDLINYAAIAMVLWEEESQP